MSKARLKPSVYRKRLLKLADIIEANEGRFDWSQWVGSDYQGKPDLSCGTSACALGWATTMPALRREGLCLEAKASFTGRPRPFNSITKVRHAERLGMYHFGVTMAEACMLLYPDSHGNNVTIASASGYSLYDIFQGNHKNGKEYAYWLRGFVARKDELISAGHSAQWGTARF